MSGAQPHRENPPTPTQRPWWQRLYAELKSARERRARRDAERNAERDVQAALAGLSEGMLRDIGAPDWMHETDRSADEKRDRQRVEQRRVRSLDHPR